MKVVIMAGGKGTRISEIANNVPKPLVKIEDKPILEHELLCLKNQGFEDILITVSHFGDQIMEYFGDGSRLGLNIEYFYEKEPLGNAGALFEIKDKLSDDFLLLNADSLFDIDFKRFVEYHRSKGGLATLFTHPNSHPYDSGLIISDANNSVITWLSKEDERPRWYKNRVNAGVHILSKKLIKDRPTTPKVDLDRQILKPLAGTGKMFCYDSPEYVKDMGTPDRFYQVVEDYKNGLVTSKNLLRKQKAIFLDRDGTINKYVGFLRDIDDFELLEGVSEAIKMINDSGYLAIVVSNQPVIARGEVSFEELNEIHNKMETLLGNKGVYLDAIYFCPHHPDKGFDGERIEFKHECDCRKPKPGMLIKAAKEFNIDLGKSFMIGDDENDVLAGKAAGCESFIIGDRPLSKAPDTPRYKDLYSAVKAIVK